MPAAQDGTFSCLGYPQGTKAACVALKRWRSFAASLQRPWSVTNVYCWSWRILHRSVQDSAWAASVTAEGPSDVAASEENRGSKQPP